MGFFYFCKLLNNMGRKGGRANTSKNLGRSLTKAPKKTSKARSTLHSMDDYVDERNLQSITESNDLDEFLNNCVIADTNFEAEKEQVEAQIANLHHLAVPRRPPWTLTTTRDELE